MYSRNAQNIGEPRRYNRQSPNRFTSAQGQYGGRAQYDSNNRDMNANRQTILNNTRVEERRNENYLNNVEDDDRYVSHSNQAPATKQVSFH